MRYDTRWCGPTAVSIIANQPYDTVLRAFTRLCNHPVAAVFQEDILLVLHHFGYCTSTIPSMTQLVFSPSHVMVRNLGLIWDNHQSPRLTPEPFTPIMETLNVHPIR